MIVAVTDRLAPAPLAEAGAVVPDRFADRLRTPLVWLNAAGIVLVATSLVTDAHGVRQPFGVAAGAVAVAAWTVWILLPLGPARDGVVCVSALAAAVATGLGHAAVIAPLIAAAVAFIGFTRRSIQAAVALVVTAAVVLGVAATIHGASPETLLTLLAGLAIGVMLGVTRRQRRIADARRRELLAASLETEREAARSRLLEERQAVARDVHDVLAHSLGGLVLQLDAIEALLERGRVDEAAARAVAARGLAGEGLAEARRAVATLRDPSAAPAITPDGALTDLIATHRALGAAAVVDGEPTLCGLDAAHREALTRMLQEALSNARRHAPGATATIRAAHDAAGVELRVATPLTAGAPGGGGHGLTGMRERFAALGDGSAVSAGPVDGEWVVDARVTK